MSLPLVISAWSLIRPTGQNRLDFWNTAPGRHVHGLSTRSRPSWPAMLVPVFCHWHSCRKGTLCEHGCPRADYAKDQGTPNINSKAWGIAVRPHLECCAAVANLQGVMVRSRKQRQLVCTASLSVEERIPHAIALLPTHWSAQILDRSMSHNSTTNPIRWLPPHPPGTLHKPSRRR